MPWRYILIQRHCLRTMWLWMQYMQRSYLVHKLFHKFWNKHRHVLLLRSVLTDLPSFQH